MKKFAIIVAGGTGKRFKSHVPKQFEPLAGRPMLMHSVEAFFKAVQEITIIVVIAKELQMHWHKLCNTFHFVIPHDIADGGPERFHSVKNGLALIMEGGWVAVHDGARPLVSEQLIKNAFKTAELFDAVIPVVEVNDSVRRVDGALHSRVDRQTLRLVQTPQVFEVTLLKQAYLQQYDTGFTDDATVVEATGKTITLIAGEIENIKITWPHDLAVAEGLIKARGIYGKSR